MKIPIFFVIIATLAVPVVLAPTSGSTVHEYGDLTQNGSFWLDSVDQVWDITLCDLELSYTVDMSRYIPLKQQTEWTNVGIGSGVWAWMSSGAPKAAQTDPNQYDLDDKLHLGGFPNKMDELSYDALDPQKIIEAPVGDPWANYGIWFDRDGVSSSQSKLWGMLNTFTYNTGGKYRVSLRFHAITDELGTVFATVNGVQTGFYDVWRNGQPDYYPIGESIDGDLTRARVFASVWGENVRLTNIVTSGCQSVP